MPAVKIYLHLDKGHPSNRQLGVENTQKCTPGENGELLCEEALKHFCDVFNAVNVEGSLVKTLTENKVKQLDPEQFYVADHRGRRVAPNYDLFKRGKSADYYLVYDPDPDLTAQREVRAAIETDEHMWRVRQTTRLDASVSLESASKAILATGDPRAYLARATLHLERQDYEDVVSDCQQCLDMDGEELIQVYRIYGEALYHLGEYMSAIKQLANASVHPQASVEDRADLAARIQRCKQARETGRPRTVRMSADALALDRMTKIAVGFRDRGDYRTAMEELKKLVLRSQASVEAEAAVRELGYTYMKAGMPSDALPVYKKLCHLRPDEPSYLMSYALCLIMLKDWTAAIAHLDTVLTKYPNHTEERRDALAHKGGCLYKLGRVKEAGDLWNKVITEDPEHIVARFEYGRALMANGQHQDALRLFLQLFVQLPFNEEVRESIATILHKCGIGALRSELHIQAAEGFSCVALMCKDYGYIDNAALLWDHACKASPEDPIHVLNKMHVLLIQTKYDDAFAHFLAYVDIVGDKMTVGDLGAPYLAQLLRDHLREGKEYRTQDKPVIMPSKEPESATEITYLAIYFTLVKVAYLTGRKNLLGDLMQLTIGLREGRDLHTTACRNEQAYLYCLYVLFRHLPPTIPPPEATPLYVVGDSHVMSPGYQLVQYQGARYLQPMLATGCKAWHLRDESKFYPKRNFENLLDKIPAGSDVMFILGEIDCREGLLSAVEKLKYEDLEKAVRTNVKMYVDKIAEIRKARKFNQVFIHPVPPTLPETQIMTGAWNQFMTDYVSFKPQPGIALLPFANQLVDNVENVPSRRLKKRFELDGTHLHPCYIGELMQPALDKISREGGKQKK